MQNILDFPSEILYAIFSWIPASQRMRIITPVCTHFRSLIHGNIRALVISSPRFTRRYLSKVYEKSPCYTQMFNGMHRLAELNIAHWPAVYNNEELCKLLHALVECSSLRTLLLSHPGVFDNFEEGDAPVLPQVKNVSFDGHTILSALAHILPEPLILRTITATEYGRVYLDTTQQDITLETNVDPLFNQDEQQQQSIYDNDSSQQDGDNSSEFVMLDDEDDTDASVVETDETIARRLARNTSTPSSKRRRRFVSLTIKPNNMYKFSKKIFPSLQIVCVPNGCAGPFTHTLYGLHNMLDLIESSSEDVEKTRALFWTGSGFLNDFCRLSDSLQYLYMAQSVLINFPPISQQPRLHALETLVLYQCFLRFSSLHVLFSMCVNVRNLYIEQSQFSFDSNSSDELEIEKAMCLDSLMKMSKLERLVCVHNNLHTTLFIFGALRSHARLEHFVFDTMPEESIAIRSLAFDSSVNFAVSHASRLQTLDLGGGYFNSPVDFPLLKCVYLTLLHSDLPCWETRLLSTAKTVDVLKTGFNSLSFLCEKGFHVHRLILFPYCILSRELLMSFVAPLCQVVRLNTCHVLDLRFIGTYHLTPVDRHDMTPNDFASFFEQLADSLVAARLFPVLGNTTGDLSRVVTRSRKKQLESRDNSKQFALERILFTRPQACAIANNADLQRLLSRLDSIGVEFYIDYTDLTA